MTFVTTQSGFVARRVSRALGVVVLAAVGSAAASLAWADCNQDMAGLMSRRMSAVQAINAVAKSNHGKLDPVAACPRLKSLSVIEGEVLAYMNKNKDWCNIPDDIVEKMSASRSRTASVAVKACGFAVKLKQMQQQQAQQSQQLQQQQAVKLPTGPL